MSLAEIRTAWEASLGEQVEPVYRNPDGVGVRQAFKNGLIYYHSGRDVGGFVPFGPAWETWRAYGWEQGDLGYPTNAEPTTSTAPWFFSSATEFEGGSISQPSFIWNSRPPLRVLWYNTALITIGYRRGGSRSDHLNRLIEYLQSDDWDVICLGEVFDNDERRVIQRALSDTHPYVHNGPVERGLHEDGGLMMLSRYNMTVRSQSIFRDYAGEDGLSDKGVIHARISVSSAPVTDGEVDRDEIDEATGTFGRFGLWAYGSYSVDLYVTHAQAGAIFGTSSASTRARRAQARQIGSFIEATSERAVPAMVVGDFNMNFATDSGDWLPLLGNPRDVWRLTTFGEDGVDGTTIGSDGKRIDAALLYQPYQSVWYPSAMTVPRVPANYQPGNLSDHHPLDITMRPPQTVAVNLNRIRPSVTCRLVSAHAIQTTSGVGRDDTEVWFTPTGRSVDRVHLGQFSQGQLKNLPVTADLEHTVSTREDISLSLRAEEEDRGLIGSGPERIGRDTTVIPAEHASLMAHPASQRTPHPFSLMSGEGSRYAFRADIVS